MKYTFDVFIKRSGSIPGEFLEVRYKKEKFNYAALTAQSSIEISVKRMYSVFAEIDDSDGKITISLLSRRFGGKPYHLTTYGRTDGIKLNKKSAQVLVKSALILNRII